jgi:hypothetical protein
MPQSPASAGVGTVRNSAGHGANPVASEELRLPRLELWRRCDAELAAAVGDDRPRRLMSRAAANAAREAAGGDDGAACTRPDGLPPPFDGA